MRRSRLRRTSVLLAIVFTFMLTATPFLDAAETLHNGIVLPDEWPPRVDRLSHEPMPVPYLQKRPEIVPIDVGRQLFVDDFLIEQTDLRRTFHRPQQYSDNPVLRPDRPWEQTGGHPTAMVFSDGVWYDPSDQRFKMWYMGGYVGSTCYAVSLDGIRWEKPSLDVVPGTNIVQRTTRDSATVWLDTAEKDPQRRYKLFMYTHPENRGALQVCFSPDGVHWSDPVVRSGPCHDRSTVFWNPFRNVWVYSIKSSEPVGDGGPVRARRYHEGVDVVKAARWLPGQPLRWVGADRLDAPRADLNTRTQLYNLDAVAYESLMLGLFSIWRGQPDDRPKPNDLVLGFSRDGFHWHRPVREPFLPVSERQGDWNWGNVQSAGGCCLVLGDKLHFYFSGRAGVPGTSGSGVCSTGLATLRRDGFASMDAGERTGTLTTRLVVFRGKYLFVNVDADGGELRVEVLDREGGVLPGLGADQCTPVTADGTLQPVRWVESRDLAAVVGKPVRFRFHLTSGKLYSFWVSSQESGAANGYVAAGGPGFVGPKDTVGVAAYKAAAAAAATSAVPAASPKPNVVVFVADDAGWGDYGLNGNISVRTPSIDSLALDGARFDRFFVCPVCSPTRAEFLTGRYHPRGGVRGVSNGQERLDIDEMTVANAFKAAGYATGAFGKWHNGSQWPYHPLARGFDEYYGYTSGHWGEYFDPPLEHNGKTVRDSGYIVDLCTDRALDFIDRNRSRPFFCYIPFTTPHSPWAVPREYWERFRSKIITQRASLPGQEVMEHTRCALAMIENQDWNVGRVLRKLDELELVENTIVLYFSDNGPNSWRWNGGMKGRKGSTDEGGVRSPLFVRWPGRIRSGIAVREIAGAIDLLPTVTALAGISRAGEQPLDGLDLSPLLLGTAKHWPDRMIFSHWDGRVSVRTQRYRLDNDGALFDMLADPGQVRNIAGANTDIAARLSQARDAWCRDVFGIRDAPATRAEGKAGTGGLPPDDRPFPVGFADFPWTPLPARDGVPHGNIKRSSSAPNCSYFVNWKTPDDSMTWDIEVNTPGVYEVVIDYTCPVHDAGSAIELSFKECRLVGRVTPGWDPPLYTNQDTVPRPSVESQMKEFRPLRLGTIRLDRGRGPLMLRALQVPGQSVMDVRRVNLTLLRQP